MEFPPPRSLFSAEVCTCALFCYQTQSVSDCRKSQSSGREASAALVLGCAPAPEPTSTVFNHTPSPPRAPCGDKAELLMGCEALHQGCIYQKLARQQKNVAKSWGEKEESWEGISPGW